MKMLLLLAVVLVLLAWTMIGLAQMPMVYQSAAANKPVACVSAKTDGQVRKINDPICQLVLQSRYEVVWVP
jgi:hypothetical protein